MIMDPKYTPQDEEIFQRMIDSEKIILLGKMASGFAHEINNPLMIIQNYTAMLIKEAIDSGNLEITPENESFSYLQEILSECKRISKITKNLLDFSRTKVKNPQKNNFEAILVDVIELMQPIIAKSQIHLKVHLNLSDSSCFVRSDQIKQVIVNILDNSVYSLEKKYPHMTSNQQQKVIEISLKATEHDTPEGRKKYISATFFDDGIGIEEEFQSRIFEPFFTTKSSKPDLPEEEKNRGLGLGLAYSRKVIQDHGGFIEFTSQPGENAEFFVHLPAYSKEDETDSESKADEVEVKF